MRTWIQILVLCAAVMTGFYLAGQPIQEPAPAPMLAFDTMEVNMGRIFPDTPIKGVFHFTNTSDQTVVIKQVKTSCGCTAAGLSKNELKPGESGEVTLEVKKGRIRYGWVSQNAYFVTEPEYRPISRIVIKALMISDMYTDPQQVYFEKAKADDALKTRILVLSEKYTNFNITSLQYETNAVSVKVSRFPSSPRESYSNYNAIGYALDVTLYVDKMSFPPGNPYFRQKITVATDIPSETAIAEIWIRGMLEQ